MRIETISVGYMGVNCYLLMDEDNKKGVILDPGTATEELRRAVTETFSGIEWVGILLTHGHFDHIDGVQTMHELTGAPVMIHKGDGGMLGDNRKNLAEIFGCTCNFCQWDRLLEEETLEIGDLRLRVLSTPGHSPGSVCYLLENEGVMFSGDTLFENSIGRTDMPGASVQEMVQTLRMLKAWPGDYRVLPGHGDATTLQREREQNPWLARV